MGSYWPTDNGMLSLRVESSVRVTKIATGAGTAWGDSVWTRQGCTKAPAADPLYPPARVERDRSYFTQVETFAAGSETKKRADFQEGGPNRARSPCEKP